MTEENDFGSKWNKRMDELGARRGTWKDFLKDEVKMTPEEAFKKSFYRDEDDDFVSYENCGPMG